MERESHVCVNTETDHYNHFRNREQLWTNTVTQNIGDVATMGLLKVGPGDRYGPERVRLRVCYFDLLLQLSAAPQHQVAVCFSLLCSVSHLLFFFISVRLFKFYFLSSSLITFTCALCSLTWFPSGCVNSAAFPLSFAVTSFFFLSCLMCFPLFVLPTLSGFCAFWYGLCFGFEASA